MHRIDKAGAVDTIPTPEPVGETVGYFSEGDPETGKLATRVGADWLNAVQEELVNVVTGAGLSLSKTDRDQVYNAILAIAAGTASLSTNTLAWGDGAAGNKLLQANIDANDPSIRWNDTEKRWEVSQDGSTFSAIAARIGEQMPGVYNIGFRYTSGVFTICAADGSALSAVNAGYFRLPSKTQPGQTVLYRLEGNRSFADDAFSGTSQIIGNLFGTTTGVAWAEDCPFFLYAVGDDDEENVEIMLSRRPNAVVSPAAASIGAPDDAVADSISSFFSFSNIDESVYDGNPCLCFGAIRMRKTASDDWTVQALSHKDGVGKFHSETKFTFPQNQNGAASGSHLKANGGTVPQFTTQVFEYWLRRDGSVDINIKYGGDAGTDGSGSVVAQIAMPIAPFNNVNILGPAYIVANDVPTPGFLQLSGSEVQMVSNAGSVLEHSLFSNGGRTISACLTYRSEFST